MSRLFNAKTTKHLYIRLISNTPTYLVIYLYTFISISYSLFLVS